MLDIKDEPPIGVSMFMATLFRMKHIRRWSLMRNSDQENVMEHSWMVAAIAHSLTVLQKKEEPDLEIDAGKVVLLAMYHDASEVMTGDLPTPVKYHNPQLKGAFKELESLASKRLLDQLPVELRDSYEDLCLGDEESIEGKLVKAADKIAAWLKCIEERRMGNLEFRSAEKSTLGAVKNLNLPCVFSWMELFAPAFELSLDELHGGG